MAAVTVVDSNHATLELSQDGTEFSLLPFTGSISASGGEAPEADVVTFGGVGKVTGHPRVPTLSVEIQSYMPNVAAWRAVRAALSARSLLHWRITTQERRVHGPTSGNDKAKIAMADGAVTFEGTTPPGIALGQFGRGMVLQIGAKHTIDSIVDGAVTVKPAPTADVTAEVYSILIPSLRLGPFVAAVRSAGNFELAAEAALTTTLEIAPVTQLPDWVIV